MGLILDSSVVVTAERKKWTVLGLVEEVKLAFGDQRLALSYVGLTELVHGIYRADSPQRRSVRESFIADLIRAVSIYPYTQETALLAGRIWGEEQQKGIQIPYSDLLIGATALSIGFSVLTENLRDFRRIPGLELVTFPSSATKETT